MHLRTGSSWNSAGHSRLHLSRHARLRAQGSRQHGGATTIARLDFFTLRSRLSTRPIRLIRFSSTSEHGFELELHTASAPSATLASSRRLLPGGRLHVVTLSPPPFSQASHSSSPLTVDPLNFPRFPLRHYQSLQCGPGPHIALTSPFPILQSIFFPP